LKEHLARQIRTYLSDHKKRRRLIRVLFTLSVITAVSVYASLLRPAISAESQGIKITSETVTESAGKALTAKISAKAENGQDQTTFLIMTKSTGAGLSSDYVFTNNVTEIVSDSGTSLSLHRVLEKDGELAYWFTLNKGSNESFALNFASGQKASDASSAAAESAASDTTNTVTAATTTSIRADSSVTETSADQTITLSGYTGVTYEAAQTAADQDSASSTDTVVSGNTAVTLSWTEDSSSSASTASDAKTTTNATASSATTDSDASDTASLSASETASDSAADTTTDTAADTESLSALSVLSASSANATAPTGYSSSLTYKQITSASDTYENLAKDSPYYLRDRYLGIAGNFHIVAFNTATLNTHTNGNVLANNLYAKTNFGTNNLEEELSYVQNYKQVNSVSASSDSHVLVLGSDNTVGTADNGNHFTVADTKLDRPLNVWQDANTSTVPFIDLTAVKTTVTGISNTLSAMSAANLDTSTLSASAGSVAASYVTLTDSNATGVYNTTAAKLQSYSYFGIKGFKSSGTGAVIVNVDCSGVSSVTLPSSTIYVGDNALSFGEKKDFTEGGVIFNFTNCSGVTINTNLLYATILAPGATVNVNQNLNGSVIADNVNINAESHRDDFVKLPKPTTTTASVKAVKIWEYSDGTEMSDTDKASQSSVTVELDNGSNVVGSETLSADNNWTYTWTNLDSNGSYSIKETAVEGYTTSYSATSIASGEIRVINKKNTTTTTSTKTHVDVTKSWSDGSSSHTDGSVTVYLYADNAISKDSSGNPITLTLNSSNSWSGSFTDLPYYHEDGTTVINYTVKEGAVDGYTASYSDPVVTTASSTGTFTPETSASSGTSDTIVIKSSDETKALTLVNNNGTYSFAEQAYSADNTAQQWKVTYTGNNATYGQGFTLTNVKYSDRILHFHIENNDVSTEKFDTVSTSVYPSNSTDTSVTFYYNSQTIKKNRESYTFYGLFALNKYNGSWYHKYISSEGVLTIGEFATPPTITINKLTTAFTSITITNTKDNKTSVTAKKVWGSNTSSVPVTVKLYRSTIDSYSDSSGGSTSGEIHTVSFTNGSSIGSKPTFSVKDGSTLYITMTNSVWYYYTNPPDNATYTMGSNSGNVTVTAGDDTGTETYEIDHITADTTITLPDVNSWWGGSTSEYPFGGWTISSKEIAGTSAAVTGKQVDTPSGATLINSAVLNVDNDWSYTWDNNLPMYDSSGNQYYYYIVETVPDGSIATYKYTMDASTGTMSTTTITNTGTFKLPEAGGSGTFVIYLTVVLLMALSAGIYMKRHAEKGGLG